MVYNKIVLINSLVNDSFVFSDNVLPNVKSILVRSTDSIDSLELSDITELTNIAIVFVNYNNKAPFFIPSCLDVLDKFNKRFLNNQSNLSKKVGFFSDAFIQFISNLKSQFNTLKYIDIISCNINNNAQFNTLLEEHDIKVRYSTNLTGNNGDWILESDDINITPLYFSDEVRNYKYTLDAPSCTSTLIDLGTLGGNNSRAYGCSFNGSIIVGVSDITGDTESHAFKYENGIMTDLGTLGGTYSEAFACSSDGSIIIGYSRITGDTESHAFKYENGIMTDLGTLGGIYSRAYGCSSDGSIIVGVSGITGNAELHAFKYEDGVMMDLGTLGGTVSEAYDCSSDGSIIVGFSTNTEITATKAFKYEDGVMTDLGTLGGNDSYAYGCSSNGSIIVGRSNITGNSAFHAFKYETECPIPLNDTIIPTPTPITFITPPVNPQTGDYDSSRLTNSKADKVIRVYTNFNRSNSTPVFKDYVTYMRYLNGALRY